MDSTVCVAPGTVVEGTPSAGIAIHAPRSVLARGVHELLPPIEVRVEAQRELGTAAARGRWGPRVLKGPERGIPKRQSGRA